MKKVAAYLIRNYGITNKKPSVKPQSPDDVIDILSAYRAWQEHFTAQQRQIQDMSHSWRVYSSSFVDDFLRTRPNV